MPWTPGSWEYLVSRGVVFWVYTFFFKRQPIATAFKATINEKYCESFIYYTSTFCFVLKIFLTPLFLLRLPVSRTLGSHFKTWITPRKNVNIPNDFRKCLKGPGGAIGWAKNQSKFFFSCYSPFKSMVRKYLPYKWMCDVEVTYFRCLPERRVSHLISSLPHRATATQGDPSWK